MGEGCGKTHHVGIFLVVKTPTARICEFLFKVRAGPPRRLLQGPTSKRHLEICYVVGAMSFITVVNQFKKEKVPLDPSAPLITALASYCAPRGLNPDFFSSRTWRAPKSCGARWTYLFPSASRV